MCIRDRSYRFGLNAFKVLGGSFAMARYIASETGKDVSELPYSVLTSDQLRKEFGQATFFTATDGNHGRGVFTNLTTREEVISAYRVAVEMCIRDSTPDMP